MDYQIFDIKYVDKMKTRTKVKAKNNLKEYKMSRFISFFIDPNIGIYRSNRVIIRSPIYFKP